MPRIDQTVILPGLEESPNGVILPHNQTAIPGLGGSTKQEDCQSETSQNEDFEVFFSASMMDDTATQEVLDDTDDEKSESVYDA
jgi:hypothetical protein